MPVPVPDSSVVPASARPEREPARVPGPSPARPAPVPGPRERSHPCSRYRHPCPPCRRSRRCRTCRGCRRRPRCRCRPYRRCPPCRSARLHPCRRARRRRRPPGRPGCHQRGTAPPRPAQPCAMPPWGTRPRPRHRHRHRHRRTRRRGHGWSSGRRRLRRGAPAPAGRRRAGRRSAGPARSAAPCGGRAARVGRGGSRWLRDVRWWRRGGTGPAPSSCGAAAVQDAGRVTDR